MRAREPKGGDMNGLGVLERLGELARSGQTFALATVVWRQGPSSSKQGSRAIITAAGGGGGGRGWGSPADTARQPRPVRRGYPRRDDGRADLLPERGGA